MNNDKTQNLHENEADPRLRFDAFTAGVKNGGLRSVIKENGDGTLKLLDSNTNAIELIERDLPLTVREKSIKICQTIIAREAYQRENKVEIAENGKGYTVKLKISDKDTDFLSLELFAATKEQAELIKNNFVADPIKVYNTLIDSIFNN